MKTHKTPSYHRQLNRTVEHRIKTHRRYKSVRGRLYFRFIVRKALHLKNSNTIGYRTSFEGTNTALLNSDKGLDKLINDLLNRIMPCASGIENPSILINNSYTTQLINSDRLRPQCDISRKSVASTLEAACSHRPRDSNLFN